MFACSFTRRIHACCLVQLCQGKGSKSTSSIVARLLTNSPKFFSPLIGAESIIRVVSRWWYLIDNKVLNTAFIISNGQEYFHDRSRVCFANFMSVPIIFNRIFFSLSFLQRTNHASVADIFFLRTNLEGKQWRRRRHTRLYSREENSKDAIWVIWIWR